VTRVRFHSRILRWLGGFSLFLLATVGVVFVWWRNHGRPQRDGRALIPALGSDVTVHFDDAAVPHVRAASLVDAARALGWLHANERMGQMELQRRYAAGRLAELVGSDAVPSDRRMRQLGIARAARAYFEACSQTSRELLSAYAQGVNAWLDAKRDDLPPDLVLLRAAPEPWREADSLGIQLLMAQMLSFGEWRERARMRWLSALGLERTRELMGMPTLAVDDAILALAARNQPEPAPAEKPSNGSNNWAVAGERSETGSALVANDPHLALDLPSLWYQAQIRCPEYEAAGFTIPGLPMVVIGQGPQIAWGFTNTELDVCDLFLERMSEDERSVERDGEWLPLRVERETIRVRDAADEEFEWRASDIGPLYSSLDRGLRTTYSIAWTAYTPFDPLEPFVALARAKSVSEVPSIAGRFVCPPQNLVCGDMEGTIAHTILGRSVARGAGEGKLPLPAWKRANHWQGLASHESTPLSLDPESGLLATANEDSRPPDFPHSYPQDSAAPQRGQRIRERLAESSNWNVNSLATLQVDTTSLYARDLVAKLPEPAEGSEAHRAWRALRNWDGNMTLRGTSALYALLERELGTRIFGDELAATSGLLYSDRYRLLLEVLDGRLDERWCDDVRTDARETRSDIITAALDASWREGSTRFGDDIARWDYGSLHVWTPEHKLGALPVVGSFFNRAANPVPGNDTCPCVFTGSWSGERIDVNHGASLRFVADCADPDRSLAVLPGGQSGHPFDEHYGDQIELYLRGEARPQHWTEAAIRAHTISTLELVPRP
jgi:penicillin amidase